MKYVPKDDPTNPNISKHSILGDVVMLGVSAVIIMGGIYWGLGVISGALAAGLSQDWEDRIFQNVSVSQFIGKGAKRSPEMEEIVGSMGPGAVSRPVEVYLACSKTPNAFAFPGGKIVVTSGALELLKSEQGLVFLLGHELGHIKNRDHLKSLGRGLLTGVLSVLAGFQEAQILVSNYLNLGFNREQERDADKHGVNIMKDRYDSLLGADEFFQGILKEDESVESTISQFIPQFASTHPDPESRIEKLNQQGPYEGELIPLKKFWSYCL